jgi:hypothetical protein
MLFTQNACRLGWTTIKLALSVDISSIEFINFLIKTKIKYIFDNLFIYTKII